MTGPPEPISEASLYKQTDFTNAHVHFFRNLCSETVKLCKNFCKYYVISTSF